MYFPAIILEKMDNNYPFRCIQVDKKYAVIKSPGAVQRLRHCKLFVKLGLFFVNISRLPLSQSRQGGITLRKLALPDRLVKVII